MEESYIGIEILKIMEFAKCYNNALANLAVKAITTTDKKSLKILDFGAGIGTISEILRGNGIDAICLETNKEEINILKSKGFKVYSDINQFSDNSLDNIASYNVFEHIENDKEILKQVYNKLKKDGKLFIFVPAYQKLYSEFDKRLGHFRRYEKEEFLSLVQSAGFKIKEWHYFDSFGYFLALAYRHIKNDGNLSKNQVKVFDKIVFPLSKIFDSLFKNYFGKNIYAIAVK